MKACWEGQPLEEISDEELERARALTKKNLDGASPFCPVHIMEQFMRDYATAEYEAVRRRELQA